MGSIQVSFDFEEWRRIHEAWLESDLTGYSPGKDKATWRGKYVITFEQVAKIEALRRQIEQLQNTLFNDAKAMYFAIADDVGSQRKWVQQIDEVSPLLREVLCKFTVAKILKLLDESERLGVDVSKSKETLLEFLEEIKPKENTNELR